MVDAIFFFRRFATGPIGNTTVSMTQMLREYACLHQFRRHHVTLPPDSSVADDQNVALFKSNRVDDCKSVAAWITGLRRSIIKMVPSVALAITKMVKSTALAITEMAPTVAVAIIKRVLLKGYRGLLGLGLGHVTGRVSKLRNILVIVMAYMA